MSKVKDKFFGELDLNDAPLAKEVETDEVVDETVDSGNDTSDMVDTSNVAESSVNLTHKAITLYKDASTGMFRIGLISCNPTTGDVGTFEPTEYSAGDRLSIQEQFKIQVIKSGIFDA